MSTWEERMAVQAEAKGWTWRQEREREDRVIENEFKDEHAGHHSHLNGTMVECSCGCQFGVTCVVFPEFDTDEESRAYYDALACSKCGKKGVWLLGDDGADADG
jgi:hypothetical protein